MHSTPVIELNENNHNSNHQNEEDVDDFALTIKCEHIESCDPKKENCDLKRESTIKECPGQNGKHRACYSLWRTEGNETFFENQGCMIIDAEHCSRDNCTDHSATKRSKNLNYCCCYGDLCNQNVSWEPKVVELEKNAEEVETPDDSYDKYNWLIASFLIMGFVGVCIGTKYAYKKKNEFKGLPTSEPEMSISTQCLDNRPITLLEIKAHGRFGTVWKAQFKTEDVAVKVFPTQDKASWKTEQEIYKLPRMNHTNILHFIGAEVRMINEKTEYWLITEYQPLGSLCDYLKSHTVNWQEMTKIAESMARGLMHLHEEIPESRTEALKPAIAHRDFKSKNVLLKPDLTACIADFGLALRFQPGQPVGDVHGQVGTRRYMAPEILEGAINFNRDSFLRIDVYACGLVLWELVSRCTAHGNPVEEYSLPFEAELGPHPTHEQMQECIAAKKIRPKLYDEWRTHPVSFFRYFILYNF